MQKKLKVNLYWLQKAAICLAFFSFLTGKCFAQLGTPPQIAVQPLGVSVPIGGTASFSVTVISSTTPSFSWLFNGRVISKPNVANVVVPLVGTTSTLTLSNVTSSSAGNYSVRIQNDAGTVTSSNALLVIQNTSLSNAVVRVNILSQGSGKTNNGFRLQLLKPANSNCVIEASSDLSVWTPIGTNTDAATNTYYLDSAATNFPLRYYRARLQ